MDEATKKLILKAAAIARVNPGPWQQLTEALAEYADGVTTRCVNSPAEDVHQAQGRAQQAIQLVNLFKDAVETADRIEGR